MISTPVKLLTLGLVTACAGLYVLGCVKTSPDGKGSVDVAGNERDPSEILPVGVNAPKFSVVDTDGATVDLEQFKGTKNIVLVFYPGDDTPGCTKQLCTMRDDWAKFEGADTVVYGVNPAGAESHRDFIEKYNFPFPLLVDTEGEVVRAYGTRGLAGVTIRTVYAINKDGKIVFAKRGMPGTEEILAAIPKG